ncbi:hypothetical protein JP75_00480 [Devosia riboflavina]|uniref:Acyltransferase 3 domain-containing protein n=1 Tax=Devosia riboflavina TaxID=46914 RepID=A0A087M718_9HYPH|nr:hypothetical protein [Devosia riboflavina]KFL32671.1 hypothetical protein JP75_00480 [Devosia riboflavina]
MKRSSDLDLFKTMLVVGMVLIHVFQLLGRSMPDWVVRVEEGINLITFSGFLLAMGIGVGMGSERERGLWERLRPVGLLLLAAWISAFAFALLVDRTPLTWALALDVLSFRRLFGWSEFLASFFMLYLLLALFRPLILRMALDPLSFGLAVALSFASTWITLDLWLPASATLLSTTLFASFPLLPYLPWFLVGIRLWRSGGKLSWLHWALAVLCSGFLALQIHQTGALPGRFPPTVLWVIGPALALALYWALARLLAAHVPNVLLLPGRHVLSYLLVSNLLIFSARRIWGRPLTAVETWLGSTLGVLVVIGVGWWLLERWRGETKFRAASVAASTH